MDHENFKIEFFNKVKENLSESQNFRQPMCAPNKNEEDWRPTKKIGWHTWGN